jgi:threonine/homoserine/homoserine lactone efflux protein
MVPPSRLAEFAGIAAVLIAVPGPSVLFTIGRALSVGRRGALFTVVGNEVGLCVQVVAVALGAGSLVQRSAEAFTIAKWACAAYLVYLGVRAVRHRSLASALASRTTAVPPRRAVRDGFVVGAMNPKTIAFFVVALPQFANSRSGSLVGQMLVLGAVFPVIAFVLDSLWAVAAGTARQWLASSPRRLSWVGGAGGLVMIGLGASVVATGRKS